MSQPPSPSPPTAQSLELKPDSIARVCILYSTYFASLMGLIVGIWQFSEVYRIQLFGEGSPLEWTQAGMMACTAVLFFVGSRLVPRFRELMWLLTAPPLLACTRELDKDLDRLLSLGWQLPFVIILLSAGFLTWRRRGVLTAQLNQFIGHRSFALMFSGLAIAIPFAQMIGHGAFLKPLFGHAYRRDFTRLIEECGEMFGYWMILLAAIDWILAARREPDQSN